MSEKKRRKIDRSTAAIAKRIRKHFSNARPGIKTKAVFGVMRLVQKNGWNRRDMDYWKDKGWLGKGRPWKA